MADNRYIDTRGIEAEPIPFTEAVINGLAQGGGLYVPQNIPQLTLDDILALAKMPYAQQAAFIYRAFGIDVSDERIDELMAHAYGAQFDDPDICPITSLGDSTHVLELWHGPTSAFKDMALQCLPWFFSASADLLRERGVIDHRFLILVATSGDTGKAALEGFCDVPGVSIGVMYPHGGVSDVQFKQMATQRGSNVQVWGVHGNFDDCQTGAKAVFNDEDFAQRLMDEQKVALSSANSINWGRLLPQIVYYVSAYARMAASGAVEPGARIDVCVPTGNFGNILAAWYAKRIGTPIDRLICASNENRVLTDFIETGTYDISQRKFVLTPSPSMDILVSSNLERQLFELSGRDAGRIAEWMASLASERRFTVDEQTFAALRECFVGGSADNATCLETIRRVYEEYGYLLDPHTAVAWHVAQACRRENPVLIASTAHWAKFGVNVYRALHGIAAGDPLPSEVAALSGCELNDLIAREVADAVHKTAVPQGLAELDELPVRFTQVIEAQTDAIEEATLEFLCKLSSK